jgi:hypothetical protein
LSLAAATFDLFVTADQNRQFQQNLAALPLSVAVLVARYNCLETLRPLAVELSSRLSSLTPLRWCVAVANPAFNTEARRQGFALAPVAG